MGNPATFPADVAPTLAHELVAPIQRQRGWVAVPTYDLREYVKAQLLTAAAGFVVGVGIGAALGNVLKGTALARNGASRRRTSTRKRERGRPSGQVVNEGAVTVTIDGTIIEVRVDRGSVVLDGVRRGSVYDLGTSFVAVPRGGESKRFGTLAGAVKHVLRHAAA